MSLRPNVALSDWIESIARVTTPSRIVVCDGSDRELRGLEAEMVADGSLIPLDAAKFPHSFLHRSHPSDVARTEQLTFICSESREDAGPTNNWMSPDDARARVWPLFSKCMAGRTMYVVPYVMGPVASPFSRVGVEITDSPYVVANLRIMTRMGDIALRKLGDSESFVRGVHSLGDLSPERRFICHFPETATVWSIGSGYGGNALLSKKCHALRLASVQAKNEGWLAEHMLVVGVTDPRGRTTYFAAAFPSGCGKTNLAMLVPSKSGYRVETIGDDIAWMRVGSDGRLWAINPEAGMFGIAVGTNTKTNPNAMDAVSRDTIFTNVALRPDMTPWWEGIGEPAPPGTLDWQGRPSSPDRKDPLAHPNARYTAAASQCPSVSEGIHLPGGVPISGIIFGGRRARLAPLVFEATSFAHGVYVGATLVSETTAAATGKLGVARHDPMAMLPFCGYNMADYFRHWLDVGKRLAHPPRVFHVNWFRTADAHPNARENNGAFLWPGYSENIRVLEWMIDRIHGDADARSTLLGYVPTPGGIDLSGLGMPSDAYEELFEIDGDAWATEAEEHFRFLSQFGSRLPDALVGEHAALVRRIASARSGPSFSAAAARMTANPRPAASR
jgi:phosphoenolpyruvate carboxykinase (GTP)